MRIEKHSKTLLATAMLMVSAMLLTAQVLAAQPPFSAEITITGDLEIAVGETTTLTAVWSTNRDVTRYEWSVDGMGQGEVQFDGVSSGSATFDFSSATPGTFNVSFSIWHHKQCDRYASAWVLVTVVEAVEYRYETAYAYSGDYVNCFIDNGFSNWGWSNGPLSEGSYTFDLYAGAGQCDLGKGILVGTVTVNYAGGELTVEFNLDNGIVLEESHVYAGGSMFPLGNSGKPTVAPGQYYIEESLEGDIYVIVHAVVGIPQ